MGHSNLHRERLVKRAEPKGVGYSDINKDIFYRIPFYRAIKPYVRNIGQALIAMLPTTERLEIGRARQAGFSPDGIIAIDNNPAIIRIIQKHNAHMWCICGDIVDAAKEIAAAGLKVNVFNADVCATLRTAETKLEKLAEADCFAPRAVVSATLCRNRGSYLYSYNQLQRGRRLILNSPGIIEESPYQFNDMDYVRAAALSDSFGGPKEFQLISSGIYMSQSTPGINTTMHWVTGRKI